MAAAPFGLPLTAVTCPSCGALPCDQVREPAATAPASAVPEDPCVWMIVYSDAGVPHETFSGAGATLAAHARFDQVRIGYNCHLFVRVAKG